MSAPPPSPNDGDPSIRYSFEEPTQRQQPTGMNVSPQNQTHMTRYNSREESDTVGDEIVDTLDETLGISDRLFGCSWWLLLLPFRIIAKVIGFFLDAF